MNLKIFSFVEFIRDSYLVYLSMNCVRSLFIRTFRFCFVFRPFQTVLKDIESSAQRNKNIDPSIYITQLISVSFIKYNFSCCIFFILIDSYCIFIMQLCDKIILSIYNYLHMDLINKKNNSRIHSSRFLRVRREMLKNRL